jgi:hypothetical protein
VRIYIERAFGVLQDHFAMVRSLARFLDNDILWNIMVARFYDHACKT